MSGGRPIAAVLAMIHLIVVFVVCTGETVRLIRSGLTMLPRPPVSASAPPTPLPRVTQARWIAAFARAYLHIAGVASGYGFFAPNIPPLHRLSLTVSDRHNRVQHGILSPTRGEKDLRLASFLDSLGRRTAGDVRDIMFSLLGEALFAEHPEATSIHVAVEKVRRPDVREFKRGVKETIEPAYAYEFRREAPSDPE
jgi:hypothetical protein